VPGAGWGILDVRGRPKAAYWYVRRALAPVAVWMTDEGTNGVAVHVANDTAAPLPAQVSVELHRPDGRSTGAGTVDLELAPHTVAERGVEGILGRFADAGYAFRFGPPEHDVVVAGLRVGGELVSQAFHFPLGRPATLTSLELLGLEARTDACRHGRVRVELASQRLAYAVALDVPGFVPDDDVLTLAPRCPRSILLTPRPGSEWRGGSVRPLNADGHVALPDP
jgi:beta-mannosidase